MSVTIQEIQKAFTAFQKEHNNNIPIEANIYETQEDLYGPENSAEKTGIRVDGEYLPAARKINLFARSFHNIEHVQECIRHELNGHYAINTLNPTEKRELLDQIIQSRNEPTLKVAWDYVENNKAYDNLSELRKAEEVYAFVAEPTEQQMYKGFPSLYIKNTSLDPNLDFKSGKLLNVINLRAIADSIENGITAGIRHQKTFSEADSKQFKALATNQKRLTREEQEAIDRQNSEKAIFLAKEVISQAAHVLANHPYLTRKKLKQFIPTWLHAPNYAEETLNLYEIDDKHLKSILGYTPRSNGNGGYLNGRILVVPIANELGLTSLEFIDERGIKSALAGGRKAGSYYEPDMIRYAHAKEIYIAEGVATSLSIREALRESPGTYVAAALSAGNLKKTAQDIQNMTFGEIPITICADIGNGYMLAKKAVAELNWEAYKQHKDIHRLTNYIAQPLFHPLQRMPDSSVPSDFNDLWQLRPHSVEIDLNNRKHLQITQSTADLEVGEIVVGILRAESILPTASQSLKRFVREIEQLDHEGIGHQLLNQQGMFKDEYLEGKDQIINDIRLFMTESVSLEIDYKFADLSVDGQQGSTVKSTLSNDGRSNKMTNATTNVSKEVPDNTPEKFNVTEGHKLNAAMIYGQGVKVFSAKPGAVYKGDISIRDDHVLQQVGQDTVILHDKNKLKYVSEEFKKTAETYRRPDVAIYYQDKEGKTTDVATVFPFSRAKDDLERVVAGLKKSAKELGMPDMDKQLDVLADRSWARNQEIRKEKQAEKTAIKESKASESPKKTSRN